MPLGGGPVEIGSGVAGLAYSLVLGRRQKKELLNFRPHNVSLVALGTWILWLGKSTLDYASPSDLFCPRLDWVLPCFTFLDTSLTSWTSRFNAGSAYGANLRAIVAAWNSFICAAMAGITWCLLDYRLQHKYTMVGFCSGTIAGLVAATPSSGFVSPWASLIIGVVAGGLCNYATNSKLLYASFPMCWRSMTLTRV